MRRALRAEAFGRRVAPTREAYRAVAERRGSDGLIEALISRHNQRWENIASALPVIADSALEPLHLAFPIDTSLYRLGVDFAAHPSNPAGGWVNQLFWGMDSASATVRMLMAGNVVGAAVIARSQLERWSLNVEFNASTSQGQSESKADYLERIWRTAHPGCPSAGSAWTDLSEILHGRGPLIDLVRWDSQELSEPPVAGLLPRIQSILDAIRLSLRQIRMCIATLGTEAGWPAGFLRLTVEMPDALPMEIVLKKASAHLIPLTYGALALHGDAIERAGAPYERDVIALASRNPYQKKSYSARTADAWAWRRSRAVLWAKKAFAHEAELLGAEFNPASLETREWSYIMTAETAGLLAKWSGGFVGDALSTAAASLRAALWLWLEDDPRAMSLARTVLEQTARARTWRVKPARAKQIEDRGSTVTTRDWLDAAGWRRLSVLNRSLSEFAHFTRDSRWRGAHQALEDLHHPFVSDENRYPTATARGDSLNLTAYLLGYELVQQARLEDDELAEAFSLYLPFGDEDASDESVEAWLQHAWSIKNRSFGEFPVTTAMVSVSGNTWSIFAKMAGISIQTGTTASLSDSAFR